MKFILVVQSSEVLPPDNNLTEKIIYRLVPTNHKVAYDFPVSYDAAIEFKDGIIKLTMTKPMALSPGMKVYLTFSPVVEGSSPPGI